MGTLNLMKVSMASSDLPSIRDLVITSHKNLAKLLLNFYFAACYSVLLTHLKPIQGGVVVVALMEKWFQGWTSAQRWFLTWLNLSVEVHSSNPFYSSEIFLPKVT